MLRPAPVLFFAVMLIMVGLAGCGGPSIATRNTLHEFDYEVARFDPDYTMTAARLYDHVFYTRYEPEGGIVNEATIKEVRDSVLVDTICGLKAREFNLRQDWLQYFVYKSQVNDFLNEKFWTQIVRPQITWDTAEVIEYYEEHPEEFEVDDQINLYHILCSPRGWDNGPDSLKMKEYSREELWALAKEYAFNVHRILDFGEAFQNAAYVLSHDMHTREQGGFVGWTERGVYKDPFDSVAFALEPFEYSEPYKDENGWHIIYNEGMVEAGTAPIDTPSVFASARQSLTARKYDRRANEVLDSLRALLDLVVNPVVLDTNVYKLEDSTWAGVVGGMDTIWSREIKMFEEAFRRRYRVDSTTAEIRREMIKAAADKYIVVQAARSHGLDTLAEAREYRERVWHSKCKMLVLEKPYHREWKPTDSMVEAYYNEHIEEFQPVRPLEVEHLEVGDSALAEFLAEQVRAGVDMADLEREYGGNQGYSVSYEKPRRIGRDDVELEYYVVASRATPKVGAQVARTPSGYFVIRVVEKEPQISLPMAEGRISNTLIEQKYRREYEQYRDSVFEEFNVTFPGELKAAEVPMLKDGRLSRPAD